MYFNAHKFRGKLVISVLLLFVLQFAACQKAINPFIRLSNNEGVSSVNIAVTDEGLYQVMISDLGWEGVDLNLLQLFRGDQQIPVWITGEGRDAKIHFYGEASESIYTKYNVYQLKIGSDKGRRTPEDKENATSENAAAGQFYGTIRMEENTIYSPIVDGGDHWFWARLLAPTTHSTSFELAQLSPGEGNFAIHLWGITKAPTDPDHHITIRINGQIVSEGYWDGQNEYTFEGSIPDGVLQEGTNLIEIESPGDVGSHIDITFLDWIEISYPRGLQFDGDDQFIFSSLDARTQQTTVREDVFIFDVTHPADISVRILSEEKPLFRGEAGHRFVAVQSGNWLEPKKIEATVLNPDLRDPGTSVDYVAIGPEDLLAPLTPLLDLRADQDLKVKSIPIKAIYDQFNGGMEEPEAIHSFLAFAAKYWQTSPRYVLLVGDAVYDFRDYTKAKNINRLPVMMIQTRFGGETGSDVLLADINDDPWPELAIGRLPAQTSAQVEAYVSKVLDYEGHPLDPHGARNILAVADGQERYFKSDAAQFLDSFPANFNTTLLTPKAGEENASQAVVEAIEQGPWLTAYFGHGSINMWGKDKLFTIEDVNQLSNGDHLPIMLNFTCLTGLFSHPKQDSLTESLLWHPDGGAIAVLAPTSLTLSRDQKPLSSALVQSLLQPTNQRLGDVVLEAWRQMPVESGNALDVMMTFLLFGDPALKLP